MATTALCESADVQLILSATGVSLRVDDDATATAWAIDEASQDIYGFALLQYEETDLNGSVWVEKMAARVAAWYLCARRGNAIPKSIQTIRDVAWKELERVELGQKHIPDAPKRKASVPVYSQIRMRMRPFPRPQVEAQLSTGTAEGYTRFTDPTDVFDYSI